LIRLSTCNFGEDIVKVNKILIRKHKNKLNQPFATSYSQYRNGSGFLTHKINEDEKMCSAHFTQRKTQR